MNDPFHKEAQEKNLLEKKKEPLRTDVINYLLSLLNRETTYLEIGVRNPENNFNHIRADKKYSVDPGLEFKENPVDFNMTSDVFFERLRRNEVLSNAVKFDVMFIDGLHLADQVDADITNAMDFIRDDGFIVLHDCNPPTEWHAREEYKYVISPARGRWNGTTWKAFVKWRSDASVNSCCIDTDWGVGILSKKHPIGKSIENANPFYEYSVLDKNRTAHLNLISFDKLKEVLEGARVSPAN